MSSNYQPAYPINSPSAKKYEKAYRKSLKKVITEEGTFRFRFEAELETWGRDTPRGQTLYCFSYDIDKTENCFITNANGIMGNHVTLKELCLAKGITNKEDYDCFIKNITQPIKPSRWKEKFYRYIHLRDMDNAVKYHEKVTAYATETMEEYSEKTSEWGSAVDNSVNGDGHLNTVKTGEQGYLEFCNEMKKGFENRIDHLKFLSARISRWD